MVQEHQGHSQEAVETDTARGIGLFSDERPDVSGQSAAYQQPAATAPRTMPRQYPDDLKIANQDRGYESGQTQTDARNHSLRNAVSPPSNDDDDKLVPFPPLEQGIHHQFETNSLLNQDQGQHSIPRLVPAARVSAPQLSTHLPFIGTTPQRNYTAPGIQRVGRGSSGADRFVPEPKTDVTSTSPKRQAGRGGKGKGRHGSYGGHMMNDPSFAPQQGDRHQQYQNGQWKRPWSHQAGPQNVAHANTECRNDKTTGTFMYKPCACTQCNQRNRSVWVVINEKPDTPVPEVQTRLKYGLGARFGDVEGVFPIQCHDGIAFIVR